MKLNRLFTLCAVVAVAAAACQEEPLPDAVTPSSIEIPVLSVGGSTTVSFSTNCAWTASSDASFVTVSPESGEAGDANLTLSVTPNDTFEERVANVTVVAGSITTVYKVRQAYTLVFGAATDKPLSISAEEQTFAIQVTSNESYEVAVEGDWLTLLPATRAVPVTSAASFKASANTGLQKRTATITITSASGSVLKYAVEQAVAEGAMKIASVKYISNVEDTYNPVEYAVSFHSEYELEFDTEDGKVFLAINTAEVEKPLESVPAGGYEVDATNSHAAGTFSVAGAKYYTRVLDGNREITVIDGSISIESDGKVYSVTAALMDASEKISTYVYKGEFPAVEDASTACSYASVSYVGDYYTYFASGAKGYSFSLYPSDSAVDADYPYYFSFTVYADKSLDEKTVPTGKFTLDLDPEYIDSPYQSGTVNYKSGTITSCSAYGKLDPEKGKYYDFDIPEMTVEIANVSGTVYSVKIDAKMKGKVSDYIYDENTGETTEKVLGETEFTYSKTFEINIDEIQDGASRPQPDVDASFTGCSISSMYTGFWYGSPYENINSQVWFIQWSYVNGCYMVCMPIVSSVDCPWIYEKNFGGRFCNTPIPDGVYTYAPGYEPVADAIGNLKSITRKAYVKNTYTGTVTFVTAGTVTFAGEKVSFDLEAANTEGTVKLKFDGGFDTSCQLFQNYTTSASRKAQATWAVAPSE
ncbi:MAG: BACON domain-containing protein [Candidatus Cryptobacteroides sp.]|nr:BACON domain-containing protein [Candidatus Cryptobacteroides sp.]